MSAPKDGNTNASTTAQIPQSRSRQRPIPQNSDRTLRQSISGAPEHQPSTNKKKEEERFVSKGEKAGLLQFTGTNLQNEDKYATLYYLTVM